MKKIVLGIIASVLSVVGGTTLGASAWGPERPTYTNESPASQAVFNSITNNAAVGDERDFVRIVEVHEDGTKDNYVNELHVSGGKVYEVYIYYHNDASSTYNDKEHNYVGVARESKISAAFPESIAKGQTGEVNAIISSTTTSVPKVWDEAYMIADEDVTFAYVNGSAKIYNDWGANGSVLSTNLFSTEGTYIGLNELNGLILGCDEFSGQVAFRIRASSVEQPAPEDPGTPEVPVSGFEIDKKVSNDGGSSWVDYVDVKPGDEVEFRILYKNTGSVAQRDVSAFDTLEGAVGMEYVSGSTRFVRGGVETKIDDEVGNGLFQGGLRIGDVEPGVEIEVFYKAKIKADNDTFACGKTVLHNLAGVSGRRADQEDAGLATVYDKVAVNVIRTGGGCLPTALPETGPAQVILAGVVSAGVLVGLGYWLNSKMQLRRLEKVAKGEPRKRLGKKAKHESKAEEHASKIEKHEGKKDTDGNVTEGHGDIGKTA
ncbi:DUF11 domain-containing protein [Candidatus Saccharibacteria bacterium]|nr:DUF11 domain-containing protein [Candidatus Saccharibacteria bacterium]